MTCRSLLISFGHITADGFDDIRHSGNSAFTIIFIFSEFFPRLSLEPMVQEFLFSFFFLFFP